MKVCIIIEPNISLKIDDPMKTRAIILAGRRSGIVATGDVPLAISYLTGVIVTV